MKPGYAHTNLKFFLFSPPNFSDWSTIIYKVIESTSSLTYQSQVITEANQTSFVREIEYQNQPKNYLRFTKLK